MKSRFLSPFATTSLKKCFSSTSLPAGAFCATILSFTASTGLQAATWDGGPGGTGTDIGLAANWSPDGLPNVITGDIAEWNGTAAGTLALVYSNAAFAGAAGNLGINLSLTAAQTAALSLDSGANTSALRMNGITIAAGAGAFTLGDGAGIFNLTMGGAAGTHTWTNNSSNTATLATEIVLGRGGNGLHTLALTGTGNWTLNNLIPTGADAANNWLVSKSGTGTATLAGANTYLGTTVVTAGTLNYTGSVGLTGTAAGAFSIGASGGGNARLNIPTGGSIKHNNTNMLVGLGITNVTGQGFVHQSGGTVSGMNQLQLGAGASGSSYGYYKMSGGTLGLAELDLGGFNGASTGVLDLTAGTVNVSAWIVPARGVSGVGILNMTGGTLNFTGPAAQFQANWGAGAASVTALNVANSSLIAAPANINLMQTGTAGKLAAINLLPGGLVQANSIAPGSATGTSLVNFNGGTLKANAATTTFLTTNLTGAIVNSGGGTLDNNGVAITIPVALQTPAGSGVTSVAMTTVGSGYLGAPAVTFTGGGGTGACGYAVLTGDTVTEIVITNPGTGYTSAPTATLIGGGGTGAVAGTPATAANTSGGMTFAGLGTTTLSGTSTYTGATSVSAGKLSVTGSLAAGSTVSVSSGATLAGTGTVNGTTTVASGGNVEGGVLSTGKLTLNSLTFSGAANVNIGSLSNYSATSAIGAGAITLSGGAGAAVIHIASLGTALPGTYKLLDYSSLAGAGFGGFSLATLPGRGTGNLVNTGTGINLNLTGLDFLKWTGSSGSTWATGIPNWELNSNGNPASYINSPGDSVVFDETGAGNPVVDISTGDVAPTSVVFNNAVADYTLQGTNGITGVTSLIKNNGAAVTITNANTYSGGTTLNGGTLNINNASAIGTGPLTIAGTGSKIDNTSFAPLTLTTNNPQNWNSDFTFTGTSELNLGTGAVTLSASRVITTDAGILTAGGIVSGTGFGITKSGDGTLVLGGVNTYTGGTTLNAGTLQLNQTTGAANTGVINVASGTLVFNPPANNFGYAPTINLSGDATISKIAASQINYTGILTGTGNVLNVNTSAGRFYMNGTVSGISQINVTAGAMGFDLNVGNRGGSAPVHVSSGASLWLANATNTVTNPIFLDGGTGQGATGALFQEGGGNPIVSGAVTLSSGDSAIGGNTAAATANVTISGQISGPGALTKIGINKYTFSGANSYIGTTTINAGTLAAGVGTVAGVSGPFGVNPAVAFANTAGALMDLSLFETPVGSLTGGGAAGGNITLGVNLLTTGADNTSPLAYAGAISGTGGFRKIGTGTQIVSGASSYTGDTVVDGGVLVAGRVNNVLNPVTSALGNPQFARNIIVNSPGTLNFAAGDTFGGANSVILSTLVVNAGAVATNTIGNFTSLGPVTLNGGTLTTAGGAVAGYQSYSLNSDVTVGGSAASTISVTGAGNGFNGVHLGTNTTFTVPDVTGSSASDLDISAPLINRNATLGGTGGLTKAGAGLLTLSGVNAYTGNTLVSGGAITLADNAQMKFAIGANGVNNSISGSGAVELNGDFNLDLTAANLTSGNSWTLVNATLPKTYGTTFTVLGFTEVGNVHTLVDGPRTWSFSEATGILTLNIAGYASWASTNANNQASNLDFDNDGMKNGVEYFMGATGSSFTANPGIVNGKVTWPKDPNYSGTYSVQTSPDLVIWTNVASTVVNNTVEYTVPTGQGSLFIRLDVTPN